MAGSALPAAAADEPRAAQLRFGHLSPDTPAVDVALAPAAAPGTVLTDPGPTVARDLAYGALTGHRELPAGAWTVSVRAPDAPVGTPPALSLRVELRPGEARTVVLVGSFADLSLEAVTDDLSAPPAGTAAVRVLAAASTVPELTVTVPGAPPLADRLAFGTGGPYVAVTGGRSPARASGSDADVPLDLPAGAVVTVLALDAPDGGTTLRAVLDAAGPARRPVGGVEAGGGRGAPAGWLARAVAVVARAPGLVGTAAAPGPTRLRVPSLGIDAALTGTGLDAAGALLPPADPAVTGWFTGGPLPGEVGPAVVTGHVDWAGRPGALSGLAAAVPGDEVVVDRADGTVVRFAVTRVERYAKTAFPGERVYAPTPGPELRVITCGGPFDAARGSYRDNVVVWARQVT